ncbi:putative N-acetylglucosaminyl-phosphatidylinositol de-N-acetylase [Vitis vinifera]|uniref:N-acetylglucosaminylphosphatidylinositol deacetylase n=1 Tax=Vitis vinifera TaxID=29760 RepID=A0A438FWG5_VITVI|nr:putative N-acetylglucosaminyl-phosphatidylinositol de-N-acetylase [Vitis vinifera]
MAWLLIIISVVLVWVASLCKTRQASFSPSKTVFLNNGEVLQKRNVLLVIAHPDDESMFFSPTITFLNSRGHNLHLLCMSTGNALYRGSLGEEEVMAALSEVGGHKAPCLDGFPKGVDRLSSLFGCRVASLPSMNLECLWEQLIVMEKDHLRQVWQDEEVLGEGCAKGERDLHVGLWKDIIGE